MAGDPDARRRRSCSSSTARVSARCSSTEGANRGLVPDDVPDAAWHEVGWLHLTGYTFFDPSTRPVAVALLAEARRRGARVSVDPSSVAFLRAAGGAVFLGWIDGADVIFPNLDEARVLVGSTGPQIDLEALAVRFPHVVVTLGSMGAAYLVAPNAPRSRHHGSTSSTPPAPATRSPPASSPAGSRARHPRRHSTAAGPRPRRVWPTSERARSSPDDHRVAQREPRVAQIVRHAVSKPPNCATRVRCRGYGTTGSVSTWLALPVAMLTGVGVSPPR